MLKRLASGFRRTAGLKKRVKTSPWGSPRGSGVHLQWETLREGTTTGHNYMKEKRANSNRVKTYYPESFLEGQSHFLQLKEYLPKTAKDKKACTKNTLKFSFRKVANKS